MKRSRSIALTTLLAGSGLSVSACDQPAQVTQWGDQAQPAAYRTLQDCKNDRTNTPEQCEAAYNQALNDPSTPKFNTQQTCEERYGVNQCVPRAQAGGGSVFVPLLTGFLLGRALNGMGGGYGGIPVYRDRYGGYVGGGGYYGGGYGGYGGGYSSGRWIGRGGGVTSYNGGGREVFAPSRVQSRSSVISRGGFGGGGGRGFSFGG